MSRKHTRSMDPKSLAAEVDAVLADPDSPLARRRAVEIVRDVARAYAPNKVVATLDRLPDLAASPDSDAITKIALGLGTSPEWSGADDLDWIAGVVGTVRPHPGDADPIQYIGTVADLIGENPRRRFGDYISEIVDEDED